VDFILIMDGPPEPDPVRDEAIALIDTLRKHIAGLEHEGLRALASAMLDLATSAANCLAQSRPGELNLDNYWYGRPAAVRAHVEAAVMRLASAHEPGPRGALECLKDADATIRNFGKVS
jgi:hypothetical protein